MEFFVYNLDEEHAENLYVTHAGKYSDLAPGKRTARVHMKDEDGVEFVLQVGQRIKSLRKNVANPQSRIWEDADAATVVAIIPALDFAVITNSLTDRQVFKLSQWDPEFTILPEQVIQSWNFEDLEDEGSSMPV